MGLRLPAILLHLEIFRYISQKLKNGNVPLYYSCHELQVELQLPAFLLYLAHSSGKYSGNLPLYYSSHELQVGLQLTAVLLHLAHSSEINILNSIQYVLQLL